MAEFNFNFDDIADQIISDVADRIGKFSRHVQQAVADREGIAPIHKTAAQIGQERMLESYSSSLLPHESYNRVNRYGAGRLRSALSSPDYYEWNNSQGIGFGNTSFLDKTAKQWSRLNYGARPRGTGVNRSLSIRSSTSLLAEFVWSREPSEAFALPVGVFRGTSSEGASSFIGPKASYRGGSTGAAFFATRKRMLGLTEGIAARDFMGAGIQAALDYMGPAYVSNFERIGREADAEAGSVHVRGYLRASGKYVEGYYRRPPRKS